MASNISSADDNYREIRDEAMDYEETVATLIAFAAFVCHDGRARRSQSHFGFGRRMTTSAANPVAPSTSVTPDCVAQKDETYGIVAEVKKQVGIDDERWDRHLKQLRKYDDSLTGWWTDDETMPNADVALLIHQSRSRVFSRYLDAAKTADPDSVGPRTSVIEFNRSDEGQSYIFFRQEWGALTDAELASQLDVGVPVPIEKVLRSFPTVNYYDAKPPLEYLMTKLWLDSLLARFDATTIDPGTGTAPISVTVSELTTELQQAYGSRALEGDARSAEFPKITWIRSALEKFVELGMGDTAGDGQSYTIHFRIFPQSVDVLRRFVDFTTAKKASKPKDDTQIPLLPGL